MAYSPFTRCGDFLGAESDMISILEEILSDISLIAIRASSLSYLKHSDRLLQSALVEIARTSQGFDAPAHVSSSRHKPDINQNLLTIKCKGRKCPPPHQPHRRIWLCCNDRRGSTSQVMKMGGDKHTARPTLAVRPPRSGLFRMASNVLRKRGSDFRDAGLSCMSMRPKG
jgi:hypothetical protein